MFSKNNSLLPRGTWWITARNTVSKRLKSGAKTTSSSKTLEILFPCLTFEKNIRSCTNFHVDGRIDSNIHTFDGIILYSIIRQSRLKRSPFALVCRLIRPLDFFEWQLYFFGRKKNCGGSHEIFFYFYDAGDISAATQVFFAKKYHFCQNNNLQNIFFLSLSSDKWRFFLLWFNSTKIGKKCLPVDNGDEPD